MAQQLVRYIRDDSTVRARLGDQFGASGLLTRERIAEIRRWSEAQDRRVVKFEIGEPVEGDEIDFAPVFRKVCRPSAKAEREAREAKAAALAAALSRAPGPLGKPSKPTTPETLIAAVAAAGGFSVATLKSRSRSRAVIEWRALAITLLVARGNSHSEAGRRLGDRDHSTAVNLRQKFFWRSIRKPEVAAVWQVLAPCVFGAARTEDEFRAMGGWKCAQPRGRSK